MPKNIEGKHSAKELKLAIVASRFNELITQRLVEGALDVVDRNGGNAADTVVVKVPGAFEIPLVARKLAASGAYDAIICLGAVIKGATTHFEHVSTAVARGIADASAETGIPISFGVITAEDLGQAIERAGADQNNKGVEAALAAIEMANVMRQL